MRRYREPRFLRSDGKPNFSTRIYELPSEIEKYISRPVITVTSTSPISYVIKKMSTTGKRRIIVTDSTMKLRGIITSTDIINYFCGGELFKIIRYRHKNNIYSAYNEPAESIMTKGVVKALFNEKIVSIIEKMIKYNVGGMPIVNEDDKVIGIITEKDILLEFSEKMPDNIYVKDLMKKDIEVVYPNTSIIEAAKIMLDTGYRRLPVVVNNKPIGVLAAMDIVRYLASGTPFKRAISGRIEEGLEINVSDIATTFAIKIDLTDTVKKAFEVMLENNVGLLIVEDEQKIKGIITERDIFYNLTLEI